MLMCCLWLLTWTQSEWYCAKVFGSESEMATAEMKWRVSDGGDTGAAEMKWRWSAKF